MQHIYLIRHGQSSANAQKLIAGQQDSPLTERGEQQAEAAGEQAAAYQIDTIVSSPLQRTRQTAAIIAQYLGLPAEEIQVIPELIERGFGDLENKHYTDTYFGSGNDIVVEGAPGLEPIERLHERSQQALERIHDLPGKHILVVCHNGTGRMLATVAAAGTPLEMYTIPRMENGVIYPLAALHTP